MELTSNALKELLNDLNHFLSHTLREETLSQHAISEKEALLARLIAQLSPAYLDMNGTGKGVDQLEEYVDVEPVPQDQIGESECYEEFPEKQLYSDSSQTDDDRNLATVDYENISIPFNKLRESAKKYGCLYRKEKFLFIEHLMRCWAGIKHDLLFIYNSERDTKPCMTLTLRNYDARSAPSYYPKDTKKKECCFEIVCPGKKTHQFIARTVKDKEQWIAAINDSNQKTTTVGEESENVQVPAKPPPISSGSTDTEEEYDDIHNPQYDDEDIYHDISDIISELPLEKAEPPPLRKRPVPSIPQEDSSDHESLYDDVNTLHSSNTYYNCLDKKVDENKLQTGVQEDFVEEEEDIYDDIGIIERLGMQKAMLKQDCTNSSGRIHHLIQRMEASIGIGQKSSVSNVSSNNQTCDSNIPSEEFYEPIDIADEGANRTDSKPMVPVRTNQIKF